MRADHRAEEMIPSWRPERYDPGNSERWRTDPRPPSTSCARTKDGRQSRRGRLSGSFWEGQHLRHGAAVDGELGAGDEGEVGIG